MIKNASGLAQEKHNVKIASWNINKFENSTMAEIAKVIVDEDSDLIFLHEFPTGDIGPFMVELNRISTVQYEWIGQQPVYEGKYNITLAFVKATLKEHISLMTMHDDMPLPLRLIGLALSTPKQSISILGLHCPLENNTDTRERKRLVNTFWDKLVNYSTSKNLMLIGDFNFNMKKPNKYKEHIKRIINNGYIDLDGELKQNTFIANTRIDYVFTHKSLTKLNDNVSLITPKYIQDNPNNEFKYTDHRMIITEINLS